jgi:hypothetical protein
LMVANNVAAFVQGHDHIWVQQQLDGVTYQTLPNPADPNYRLNFSDDYINNVIYKTNSSGYARFTVGPSAVKVEYVRAYLPQDEGPGKTNGMVQCSYFIYPATVTGTTHSPAAPRPTNSVWITANISSSTNILQASLTYIAGSSTNTIPMLDDGSHQDGKTGDGVYGAQIPAYPLGTRVRYYVHAVDAAGRQITDPSGAPANPQLFAYTVGELTPSVLSGELLTDKTFRLHFSVVPGLNYAVQATEHLTNPILWATLLNTNAGSNSMLFFDDGLATNHAQRYYRVGVSLP